MGKLRKKKSCTIIFIFLFWLEKCQTYISRFCEHTVEKSSALLEKGNFYVLSALYCLKMNKHLFLVTSLSCSLKPDLENSRLRKTSWKPFKIFGLGFLAGSSSLHTCIKKQKILIVPKINKRGIILQGRKE